MAGVEGLRGGEQGGGPAGGLEDAGRAERGILDAGLKREGWDYLSKGKEYRSQDKLFLLHTINCVLIINVE